jgi:type IV pilus assembly protein PilB
VLLHKEAVQKDELVSALEEVTGVAYVDASTADVDPEILELVPRELAEKHCMLPLERNGKTLVVVMANPQNLHILDELRFATGCEISPRIGFQAEVAARIAREYGGQRRGLGAGRPRQRYRVLHRRGQCAP